MNPLPPRPQPEDVHGDDTTAHESRDASDPVRHDLPPGRSPAAEPPALPGSPRVVAAAEVLLCSGYPTQLLVGLLLHAAGWTPTLDRAAPVIALLTIDTALLVGLMVLLLRRRGERPRDVWLGGRSVRAEAFIGVWLIPVVFLMVVVTLTAIRVWLPRLHDVPVNPLEKLAGTGTDAIAFGLMAVLAGGVREELQRAFLLHRFEQHLGGAAIGVVVLSAAFGLGHAAQGWDAVVTTGLLGAFWAVIYVRRRSMVAPMVSHAGFNALQVLQVAVLAGGL